MSIQQYLQYVYSYIAAGIKQNMFHSFTTKSKSNQVKASAKWQDQKSMPLRDQNCLLRPDPVRSGVLQWFLLMGPSYSCWPFLPHHASSKNRIGCSTRDAVIYIYIHIHIYISLHTSQSPIKLSKNRGIYILEVLRLHEQVLFDANTLLLRCTYSMSQVTWCTKIREGRTYILYRSLTAL